MQLIYFVLCPGKHKYLLNKLSFYFVRYYGIPLQIWLYKCYMEFYVYTATVKVWQGICIYVVCVMMSSTCPPPFLPTHLCHSVSGRWPVLNAPSTSLGLKLDHYDLEARNFRAGKQLLWLICAGPDCGPYLNEFRPPSSLFVLLLIAGVITVYLIVAKTDANG